MSDGKGTITVVFDRGAYVKHIAAIKQAVQDGIEAGDNDEEMAARLMELPGVPESLAAAVQAEIRRTIHREMTRVVREINGL